MHETNSKRPETNYQITMIVGSFQLFTIHWAIGPTEFFSMELVQIDLYNDIYTNTFTHTQTQTRTHTHCILSALASKQSTRSIFPSFHDV